MEKTQATPAWKTPLAFPTLPQLRRRDKFVFPNARIWGQVSTTRSRGWVNLLVVRSHMGLTGGEGAFGGCQKQCITK
jgi:hypothetical protein